MLGEGEGLWGPGLPCHQLPSPQLPSGTPALCCGQLLPVGSDVAQHCTDSVDAYNKAMFDAGVWVASRDYGHCVGAVHAWGALGLSSPSSTI